MEDNLKLPQDKRSQFAVPLGKLIAGSREETIPKVIELFKKKAKKDFIINFYMVGDIVTQDFLSNDFLKSFIRLCIIDEKTQRVHIELEIEKNFEQIFEFKSPLGTIPKESWALIEDILKSGKRSVLKITEGEEDLLVMPLIVKIPLEKGVKSFVFYGQPPITDAEHKIPQGIVIVEVKKGIKTIIRKYIDFMEKS